MSQGGHIFSLLQGQTAAEIAKRFNNPETGYLFSGQAGAGSPAPQGPALAPFNTGVQPGLGTGAQMPASTAEGAQTGAPKATDSALPADRPHSAGAAHPSAILHATQANAAPRPALSMALSMAHLTPPVQPQNAGVALPAGARPAVIGRSAENAGSPHGPGPASKAVHSTSSAPGAGLPAGAAVPGAVPGAVQRPVEPGEPDLPSTKDGARKPGVLPPTTPPGPPNALRAAADPLPQTSRPAEARARNTPLPGAAIATGQPGQGERGVPVTSQSLLQNNGRGNGPAGTAATADPATRAVAAAQPGEGRAAVSGVVAADAGAARQTPVAPANVKGTGVITAGAGPVTSPSATPPVELARASLSGGAAIPAGNGPSQAQRALPEGAPTPAFVEPGGARSAGGAGGALAAPPGSAQNLTAFFDAVAVALEASGAGRGSAAGAGAGTLASGVIFNAAMMPGWPFPSALVRDSGVAINDKAALQQLASKLDGMSPQDAAEYLAKIGNGFALLRNLRKLLKELDGVNKESVMGFLMAFFETIQTIVKGLQVTLEQMAEAEATQAAVAYGEDPDRGPGSGGGRRRITL